MIPDEVWENKNVDDKAAVIFRVLRRKKFVLLLDDLWERLDILKLGVPIPDNANGSKIIFTTRSEEVCGRMEAHRRLRIKCLLPEVALDLFRTKVGEDVLNSHLEIPKLAELIARECKGLPLALITIARAMASRRTPQEWKHALKVLQSYPSKFSEDHEIEKNELIELWIGEGFLDKFDNIYDARNEGEFIVGSLKLACLLEDGGKYRFSTKHVMMHDVIRDMALWLACENGEKENKILVQDQVQSVKAHGFTRWKEALNLSSTAIGELPVGIKNLKNLRVLLLDDTHFLRKIPEEAVSSLSSLTIISMFFYQGYQSLDGLPEFMLVEDLGRLENMNEVSPCLFFNPS
ncbi:hypothetical protein CRYUN_Cryun11dG0019000 [Craigia yunnanensis]